MANLRAIHSVGFSLVKYLRNAYPADLRQEHPCDFRLISSGELNATNADFGTAVTLYLYRVTVNPYLRNSHHVNAAHQTVLPLSVDLHYLVTIWADSALVEHTILGWVVRELYMHQTLTQSDLTSEGGWEGGDLVQLIPAELSNEDLMRLWDALDPGYRLSISYIARVVRIEPEVLPESPAVVARRLRATEKDRNP
ncbi:uncharacterized protein SOCE836_096990 [Sorangium cellulosum]|uniref:Pvc16 N-terminal domain-containing protein n=1 Tax=Sorangium cellulosum TaxID=56 RepID=A0A4P2R353_SORCE|nr:uncharacterized protein SOCE836_096990 [Sorangium cellulosum]WCQ96765.1 hypothetical protein NQZ70_09552 [Sorangium sp. Soce836]